MTVVKTHVYDVAAALLADIESYFATHTTLPDRRFVANGDVAFDCPQLAVKVARIFSGAPGAERATIDPCIKERAAALEVYLTRCVPLPDKQGNPPSVAALEASASELLTDAWILRYALVAAAPTDCKDWLIGPLVSVGPQGGHGGWVANLQVRL